MIASELLKLSKFAADAFVFAALPGRANERKQQHLRCPAHCIFISRKSDPGRLLRQRKVLLFHENQPKFAKWQRIGCLFVENTHSL